MRLILIRSSSLLGLFALLLNILRQFLDSFIWIRRTNHFPATGTGQDIKLDESLDRNIGRKKVGKWFFGVVYFSVFFIHCFVLFWISRWWERGRNNEFLGKLAPYLSSLPVCLLLLLPSQLHNHFVSDLTEIQKDFSAVRNFPRKMRLWWWLANENNFQAQKFFGFGHFFSPVQLNRSKLYVEK